MEWLWCNMDIGYNIKSVQEQECLKFALLIQDVDT